MAYSLFYFDQAKQDAKEAKAWYQKQKVGLGQHFAEAIKFAILKVQTNPLRYGLRYKNIRIAHPKIFPYCIHFYVDDLNTKIVIVAIVHNKRNPNLARDRT